MPFLWSTKWCRNGTIALITLPFPHPLQPVSCRPFWQNYLDHIVQVVRQPWNFDRTTNFYSLSCLSFCWTLSILGISLQNFSFILVQISFYKIIWQETWSHSKRSKEMARWFQLTSFIQNWVVKYQDFGFLVYELWERGSCTFCRKINKELYFFSSICPAGM